MKRMRLAGMLAAVWLVALPLLAQVEIVSFQHNGWLVASNLVAGSTATVQWASVMTGPWTSSWSSLEAVVADSNGVLGVAVPMFYRVRVGVTTLPATTSSTTTTTTLAPTTTTTTTTSTTTTTASPPPGMVLIPAGSFSMGNALSATGDGNSDELPVHTVYVSAFYMDRTEVTKALWDEVRAWGLNNGYTDLPAGSGKAANHPVQTINWYAMVKWCNARSQKEGRTPAYYTSAAQSTIYKTGSVNVSNTWVRWDTGYRLPTEAEWEKAARGGASGRRFPWSDSDTIQHTRANYRSSATYVYDTSATRGYHPDYDDTGFPHTSPVGSFAANGYGLYDMAGNVWEWCWDWYGSSYYGSSPGSDPRGLVSGSERMDRGGSWGSAYACRVANRHDRNPGFTYFYIGCRSCLPPGP